MEPVIDLRQGDALAILPTLADNSIDLVATDPPYCGVKDDEWDRQWATRDEYLAWLDKSLAQFARVLKPNGSLYVFASPQMAAHVEVLIGQRFNVLNSITWAKPGQSYAEKYGPENFRQFVPMSERIIFAEHFGADNMAKGEANRALSRTSQSYPAEQDARYCGTYDIVSPSCPEHGGLYALAYMALCDVHAGDGLSRIEHIYSRHAQALPVSDASNSLMGDDQTNSDSSDSPFRECSGFATPHNTMIRKMGRALLTFLPNWEDETVSSRIERTLARLAGRWIYEGTRENNRHAVCFAARRWLENPCHTADTSWFSVSCTCPPPRSISHFAGKHKSGEQQYKQASDDLRGFIFEPLRAYLDGERQRAGIENAQINAAWCKWKGVNSTSQTQKWFSNSCFNPPTKEAYQWLRELFASLNYGGDYLRRDYEDLRRDYEDLRRDYEDLRREYEDLRRPFAVSADVPYTDVWTFPTVSTYTGKHPCEKPLAMMEHIIRASSRPGAVVLDAFMGSGVTGKAALKLGRDFIGIEKDATYFAIAQRCLADAQLQTRMF